MASLPAGAHIILAHVIVSLKQRDGWESHRPGVELIVYLALADYETKVLVHRLMTSPDDRYIWEKYLALHLYEALQKVPKRISDAIREMGRPGAASHASPASYMAANQALKDALKPIHADKDFMTALSSAWPVLGPGQPSRDEK